MDFQISNCNNIDFGLIHIEENCLNIKYAANGTGKTTIANALDAIDKKEELKELVPYKYRDNIPIESEHLPAVTCNCGTPSIAIFNEKYVDEFLFVGDELIKGSFDIFIKTPDYDLHMTEIQKLMNDIQIAFANDPEIEKLFSELTAFVEGCGKAQKGYSKASILGKGLGKGNKIENVPEELAEYKSFIQGENNINWIAWQGKGRDFIDENDRCPYCATAIDEKRKELTKKVGEEYDSKSAQNLLKMVDLLRSMEDFFSDATKRMLCILISNTSGFTKEQELFIGEVRKEVESLRDRLIEIRAINFSKLKDAKCVTDVLNDKKIDLSYLIHLDTEYTAARIATINGAIEKVLEKATLLQAEIGKQRATIKRTIEKNREEINSFLENAGYKYHVEIEENIETYRLVLKSNEGAHISNVKSRLSYGERNAFALVLFMYSQLKENADLIILDDPISSFDKNKKYAIIAMLFRGEHSFRGRTVMMLTHDFDPIVDLIHEPSIRKRFAPPPNGYFLWNNNGELQEKKILPDDVCSFYQLAEKIISGETDEINKLVYWRRQLEACGEKGVIWDIVSSLLHGREYPIRRKGNEEVRLTAEEFEEGVLQIRAKFPAFDYQRIYERISDPATLIELYHNTTCGYEKVQLYRLIDSELEKNPIIKKYVDESYHVENDCLFQLNPEKYEIVPNYIVEFCNNGVDLIAQGI